MDANVDSGIPCGSRSDAPVEELVVEVSPDCVISTPDFIFPDVVGSHDEPVVVAGVEDGDPVTVEPDGRFIYYVQHLRERLRVIMLWVLIHCCYWV